MQIKKTILTFGYMAMLFALHACSALPSHTSRPTPTPPCVGCDVDAHGCKASAGYTWCAAENSCVRPWELGQARGVDLSGAGFQKYCDRKK